MTFFWQSCTHIKASFSTWEKKYISPKVQGFCICWCSCSDGFMNFLFFFYDGPYHEINVGSCSCRPQSMAYIKQSKFSCHAMTFLCFLEELLASLGHHGVIQGYGIALNTMKNTHKSQEYSFYCNIQFPGEMSCSCGDD